MNHLCLNRVEPVTRYPQDAKPVNFNFDCDDVGDDDQVKQADLRVIMLSYNTNACADNFSKQ